MKRKRRRHSDEFKTRLVTACRQPGISVSGVALANGLNANLLRRWIKESDARLPVRRPSAVTALEAPLTIVPVTLEPGAGGDEIRLDIRRAGVAIQLAWPARRLAELSALLKDLLR